MSDSPLVLTASQRAQIESEGASIYPNECCGIIFGHDKDNQRIVSTLEPVQNAFDDAEKYHRFSISPKQLMEADRKAGARGELVLGFYHSHPDHPARPSEYDREHAWPFYSYVIVAIEKKQPKIMTCWLLDEQTEQFKPQEIKGAP